MTLKKLIEVCHIMLREVDIIGRLEGDEFVILLPETGGEKALEVAERLRKAITEAEVLLEQSPPLHFTTSIGVATLIVSLRPVHIDRSTEVRHPHYF